MHVNQFLVGDESGKILLFTGKSKQPIEISNSLPLLALWKWTMSTNTPEAIRTMIFSSDGKYLIIGNASGIITVNNFISLIFPVLTTVLGIRADKKSSFVHCTRANISSSANHRTGDKLSAECFAGCQL